MDLPVFEMVINNEETSDVEVSFVALVDKPAIERNFMAFKDQKLDFAINEDKKIISGPAMVADQLIYRKDENGEYNVFFSPDTVRDIAVKFFKKGYQKNLNLFHDVALSVEDVTIFESFVSDKTRGIQPMKGFEDLPDGTWFISAKVDNEEAWGKIKSGEVKGFSVEGIFSFLKRQNGTDVKHSPFSKEEKSFMSKIKELYDKFFGDIPAAPVAPVAPVAQAVTTLKDGTEVTIDRLEVGGVVMIGDAPAPVGEHQLSDGTVIVVGEGGVIAEVKAMQPEAPEAPADYSEQFKAYDEKIAAYETKFADHVTAYGTLVQEFTQAKEQIKNLVQLVGQMVETPTAESVQGNKGTFNSHKPTRQEQTLELRKRLESIKK